MKILKWSFWFVLLCAVSVITSIYSYSYYEISDSFIKFQGSSSTISPTTVFQLFVIFQLLSVIALQIILPLVEAEALIANFNSSNKIKIVHFIIPVAVALIFSLTINTSLSMILKRSLSSILFKLALSPTTAIIISLIFGIKLFLLDKKIYYMKIFVLLATVYLVPLLPVALASLETGK
ncbi:membrane protein of unknown function [Oenococcus oeni]|uniref:hypothetical protein n=1 Tax=Oenococcus oeni TaxID=1247 RepID=UPI00107B542D|nr:hypothetical protein [Oenococcus oeni]AVI93653.1 hypothetical protein AX764_01730 [Oenococcus oeni]SYV98929.1 membrane hypothetical protein [Oenococcus oeni]SYW01064.1 membrane hypothetical protein [Oenococcus oeni]SYW02491.1 membrane hypothetical protein [Oenococcus oeni]SYW14468.1 membrane hypothetical protein [Oenococcus oeni]